MSKEIAKKLIAELQTNEELKTKIVGIEDRAELVKKAVEMGYDVTLDELMEAEKEYRNSLAAKTEELSPEELESAAGGILWQGEEAPDGKELGCDICNYKYDEMKEKNYWCKDKYYCNSTRIGYIPSCNNNGSIVGR